MSEYPKFLINMLRFIPIMNVKEACCRQIIKIFAEKKKKTMIGGTAGGD